MFVLESPAGRSGARRGPGTRTRHCFHAFTEGRALFCGILSPQKAGAHIRCLAAYMEGIQEACDAQRPSPPDQPAEAGRLRLPIRASWDSTNGCVFVRLDPQNGLLPVGVPARPAKNQKRYPRKRGHSNSEATPPRSKTGLLARSLVHLQEARGLVTLIVGQRTKLACLIKGCYQNKNSILSLLQPRALFAIDKSSMVGRYLQ